MHIEAGQTVLFQGDSVTDCGRDRNDPASLGSGYPALVSQLTHATHPDLNIRFLNRAVSGDRTKDLLARWDEDCTALKPDWVSILIGINDTWRRYDADDPTCPEAFYTNYRTIVQRAKDAGAKIIIMEPFLLNVPPERRAFREDLDPKIQIVRAIAQELADVFIPLDGIFAQAAVYKPMSFWAADGIHPTPDGQALIAHKWTCTLLKGL